MPRSASTAARPPARRLDRGPRRRRRAARGGRGRRRSAPDRARRSSSSRSRPTYSSLASQRIYFVMPDRYANGDPANDRGGKSGRALGDRLRPGRHRLLPRRRPERADGRLHRPRAGAPADQGSRLHRDLGDAGGRPAGRAGLERRLPRLLGPRLHRRRPAPRQRGRLQGLHRLRPPARAEGDPRRRRQPHRGRDPRRRAASSAPTSGRTATATARPFVAARYAGGKTFPCLSGAATCRARRR